MTLEAIVAATVHRQEYAALYRKAAQAWNHKFYWRSLRPRSADILEQEFKRRVIAAFGSLPALKRQLAAAALEQFGAGWAWLAAVLDRLVNWDFASQKPRAMKLR